MVRSVRRRLGAACAITVGVAVIATLGACSSSGSSSGSGSGSGNKPPTVKAAQKFANELDAAVRSGNVDFRIAHLNPAVIARYGEDQCRSFLATQQDATRKTKVKTVGKPEPFEYASDNLSTTIPDTLPVLVKQTIQGKPGERNIHVAFVNGQYSFFIDCGNAIGP